MSCHGHYRAHCTGAETHLEGIAADAEPRVFHVDIPDALVREVAKCKDDAQVKQVGIEWCTAQSRELKARGVPSIHFYSLMAVDSVYQIAKQVY